MLEDACAGATTTCQPPYPSRIPATLHCGKDRDFRRSQRPIVKSKIVHQADHATTTGNQFITES